MGAVFPLAVPIGRERLTAPGTGEFINRLLLDSVGMLRPPFLPAGFAAEYLFFHFGLLLYFRAAFPAAVSIINGRKLRRSEAVPAAETFNSILGNADLFPNLSIAPPHPAETHYFFFLFVSHFLHLLTIRRFGSCFEGV